MIEKENFKNEQDHKSYDDDILKMINLFLNSDNQYSIKVSNRLGIEYNVIHKHI